LRKVRGEGAGQTNIAFSNPRASERTLLRGKVIGKKKKIPWRKKIRGKKNLPEKIVK